MMPLFKLLSFLFTRSVDQDSDSMLFKPDFKLYTFLLVGLIFPAFIISAILGTFWYAEVEIGSKCLQESQVSWYYAMWLIVIYCWIFGYSAYFSYKAIFFYKLLELEREYLMLLEQYQGIDAPLLNTDFNGLSPHEISRITAQKSLCEDDTLCSICLESFKIGDQFRVTSCKHKFHMPCIDNWLMRKGSCPNCLKRFNAQEI